MNPQRFALKLRQMSHGVVGFSDTSWAGVLKKCSVDSGSTQPNMGGFGLWGAGCAVMVICEAVRAPGDGLRSASEGGPIKILPGEHL